MMGQYQTITLPPDIQLTPGTVLTLLVKSLFTIGPSSQSLNLQSCQSST